MPVTWYVIDVIVQLLGSGLHEARDGLGRLADFLRGDVAALSGRLRHAVPEVVLKQAKRYRL
jgi:hypothetical protein